MGIAEIDQQPFAAEVAIGHAAAVAARKPEGSSDRWGRCGRRTLRRKPRERRAGEQRNDRGRPEQGAPPSAHCGLRVGADAPDQTGSTEKKKAATPASARIARAVSIEDARLDGKADAMLDAVAAGTLRQ